MAVPVNFRMCEVVSYAVYVVLNRVEVLWFRSNLVKRTVGLRLHHFRFDLFRFLLEGGGAVDSGSGGSPRLRL